MLPSHRPAFVKAGASESNESLLLIAECSPDYAKPVQGERSGKAGKRSFTRLDIAEPQPGLCKGTKKKPYPATFIPMNGHINRINFIILTARFHMSVTPFNDNHTS